MSASHEVVFLFDRDNTLLDNATPCGAFGPED